MKEDSMVEEKLQLKKGDFFILLFVFVLLAVSIYILSNRENANRVLITAQGETKIYDLQEEQSLYVVDGKLISGNKEQSASNVVVIANGQVYMNSATCKDQICVKHKPIYKDGEVIICLPNQVFIEVDNEIKNEIDN